MALSISSRKPILLRNLCSLRSKNFNIYFCNRQESVLALDSDALDNFTTQLMQRKSNKWENIRTKQLVKVEPMPLKCGINQNIAFDVTAIDSVLHDALEASDNEGIRSAVEECIKCNVVPNRLNLLHTFSFFARVGDKAMVLRLIELSRVLDSSTLMQHSHFKHYLAQATWSKGNINEAIILFEDVYSNNIYLRRRIRSMLHSLVTVSIKGRSEAILFLVLNFAKRLGENYKDFYVLACIWRCCILSEWFTDQSIALDLLEHNRDLRKTVIAHIPMIVCVTLREHQLDLVYRILEVLMKCESKAQYAKVIEVLFDYRVTQGDLQSCTKIVQWCTIHGITLAKLQQEQYINLLCSMPNNIPVKSDIAKPPSYQFKF